MKTFLFLTLVFFMFLTLGLVCVLDFKHAIPSGMVVIAINAWFEYQLTKYEE